MVAVGQNLGPQAIELIGHRCRVAVVETPSLPFHIQAQGHCQAKFMGSVQNAAIAHRPVAHRIGAVAG